MRSLGLVLSLSLTACTPTVAGSTDDPSAADSLTGSHPALNDHAVVAVTSGVEGAKVCSGVLIAPRTILTAAHCVDWRMGNANIKVFTGPRHTRLPGRTLEPSEKPIVHPGFNPQLIQGHDLALLKLREDLFVKMDGERIVPISYDEDQAKCENGDPNCTLVTPVPLSTTPLDTSVVGTKVRGVGYGWAHQRAQATMEIRSLGYQFVKIGDANVHVDTGDSGGPALRKEGEVEHVIGIVCGVQDGDSDEDGALYSRIDRNLDFIYENVPSLAPTAP